MAKHYTVEGNKILVEIEKLTAKELAAVQNYKALGYDLFEVTKTKEDKEPNPAWTKKGIEAFLKKNATEEQMKEYKALVERPAISKKTGKAIINKDGSIRKVGIVGCFSWLKENFEEYQ